MIPQLRDHYNLLFTPEKYQAFVHDISTIFPGHLEFRVAETPLFVPKEFTDKMLQACESIIDVIISPAYQEQSNRAIPESLIVPDQDTHPHCIAFDFGICVNQQGGLEPQLIEMQGFPSLFAWEVLLGETHRKHFWWPENVSDYLNGFTKETYLDLLRRLIIADSPVENVILLEIHPHKQKTRVDFYATESLLGIKTICITDLIKEENKLFYQDQKRKIQVNRIYNRVIFDDLFQQSKEVQEKGKIFQEELEVTWVPHPNWFYRLSKFTLPFIRHPYVPETRFLNEVTSLPVDLENYVVKPLFSFAGQGVIIDVTKEAVEKIADPANWIIQRKVQYAAAIKTPNEPAKGEIRLFFFWEPGKERPVAAQNLARLSKGKMVGVRYNQDKDWVGGSFCLFAAE
ncbi:MAG TPA: hypothetical protein VHK91_17155 [Flavisolibacter sp.]|jgi:hypothetical protein|nr:hypothetical protein [Flavisolibacter sp.]